MSIVAYADVLHQRDETVFVKYGSERFIGKFMRLDINGNGVGNILFYYGDILTSFSTLLAT